MSNKNNTAEDQGLFTDKLKEPTPPPEVTEKTKAAVETKKAAPSEPKEKVIVIDDSPTILAVVCGILKKSGFSTIAHRDPSAALTAIKKMTPEEITDVKAVFSDLDMPNMSGLDVLQEIRGYEPTKTIPFVMITSQTDRASIQRAALLKVSGYLLKPVTSDTMIELVGNLFPDRVDPLLRKSARAR